MRLHYLHLPHYGPLKKLRCVFQQNTLLPGRHGAVNFVVGVNSTGKSSLLRALYHTFQCLEHDEPPPFPITLAYTKTYNFTPEKPTGTDNLLVIIDCPAGRAAKSRIQLWSLGEQTGQAVASYDADRWDRAIQAMRAGETTEPPLGFQLEADIPREKWEGNNAVDAAMPCRVVAYTSGDPRPWQRLSEPEFGGSEIEPDWSESAERDNERPPCWTPRQERPLALSRLVADEIAGLLDQFAKAEQPGEEERKKARELAQDLAKRARAMVKTDEHRPYVTPASTLLEPTDLRLAGVAIGVWHACEELRTRTTAEARDAYLKLLRSSPKLRDGPGARLFNHLNWAWPTHLTLVVNPAAEPRDDENLARILSLHGLAVTVLQQPLDRLQLVIPLGSRGDYRSIGELLEKLEFKHSLASDYAARADTSATGAEAVVRLFDKDREPWPFFEALKAWRESGWLDHATLTVLRTATRRENGVEDNVVLCLEDFSDGERELLGRTALLFLLKKQFNAFLLLDEPETHFNDAWKREVVDFVDDQLLQTTPCQVLVSTHSAISLTDVFTKEIGIIVPDGEKTELISPDLQTFGEDPGELMLRVFGADEAIGRRAAEYLEAKIQQDWTENNRAELEALLRQVGAGFYRSELRAALKKLNDHAASN